MKPSKKIRLLLVDDHFVVRMGLASSLALEADMEVAAECGSGEEALELLPRCQPDVVVMDGRLPGLSGAETAAAMQRQFPGARVLMLSVRDGEEDIYRAVQAGVRGYLHKAAQREQIIEAIRKVHQGGTWFPPSISTKLAARKKRPELTERELQVLGCVVQGRTNKEIADKLGVAEVTIKLHVGRILEKLGVSDRTQAATAALQRGYIHLE